MRKKIVDITNKNVYHTKQLKNRPSIEKLYFHCIQAVNTFKTVAYTVVDTKKIKNSIQ